MPIHRPHCAPAAPYPKTQGPPSSTRCWEGLYFYATTTRINAAGQPLSSVQKKLISELSPTLKSKSVLVCERGLTSTKSTEYSENTKRIQYRAVPTSDITAEAVTVDGFVLSQKDTAGVVTTATCPLAIQKDGTWYTYGWDLTKNICELYGQHGYIRTAYTYTPYGQVTATGDTEQPIQWSSEFNDTELGLVYYNYRHYNPVDGRWIGRDPLSAFISMRNEYGYTAIPCVRWDFLGLMISQEQPVTGVQSLDVIPNMNPSCNKCNQWISHIRSIIRTKFTPQELDEGRCRYRFKCLTCKEFFKKYGVKDTKEQKYGGMTKPSYVRRPINRRIFPDVKKLLRIDIDIQCHNMKVDNIVHEMQHAVDFCSLNPKAYNANGATNSSLYLETRAYSKAQISFTEEEIQHIKNAENLESMAKLHRLFDRIAPSYTYSTGNNTQNNIEEKNKVKEDFFNRLRDGEIGVLPYAF